MTQADDVTLPLPSGARRERLVSGGQSFGARAVAAFREFVATQNVGAVVLVLATVASLVWVNSPWRSSYEELWTTELSLGFGNKQLSLELREWINDGLMAFFFVVVGLEIRREFDMGELRERRRLATPVVAAMGGIVGPALIYFAFNAGTTGARGWGIAMGTDTAFALGVLALVGRRSSPRLRVFLLTLVIVDDIAALTVIALAYTESVSIAALIAALGFFGLVLAMRRAGVPWRATAGVDPVLRRQRAPCGGVECSGHIADARGNQRAPQLW